MNWATLRRNAGLTREQVCAALGIGSSTLYRIETYKSEPKKLVYDALLRLYGISAKEAAALLAKKGEVA